VVSAHILVEKIVAQHPRAKQALLSFYQFLGRKSLGAQRMRTISRRLLTAMQVAESGETGNYMMTRKRWCAKMSIFLRPRFHTSVFGFNTSLPGFHTLLSRLHTLCLPPGSRASSQSDRLRHHHVLVYWLVSPSVSSVWGIACWAASLNSVSSLWILCKKHEPGGKLS